MKELLNIDVSVYSTFKLPSVADRLVLLESAEDVEKFFKNDSDALSGNYYLIGAGSNSIFSPHIHCLVKIEIKGVEWKEKGAASSVVTVQAAEIWDDFVWESVNEGYAGIESLVAIPGTVGAAPVQNIGAYGGEFSDVCASVRVFDVEDKIFKNLSREECRFGYRSSIFKKNKNRYIILSVDMVLHKEADDKSGAKAKNKAVEIQKIRWSKLPKPEEMPNVGSCFENPVISARQADGLKSVYPDIPVYKTEGLANSSVSVEMAKVSAGWFIEQCGLKGYCIGGVCVYERHALVLVNKDQKGTEVDFNAIVSFITKKVKDKFNIELRLEPNRVV